MQNKIEKMIGKYNRKYQFWDGLGKGFGRVWEGLEGIKIRWKKSFNIRGIRRQVSIAALGRNLYRGGLARLLGGFWVPGPSQASILEGLGTCQAGFWSVLGSCFDRPFAAPCALLPYVFLDAASMWVT